jgi:hypothetical protein
MPSNTTTTRPSRFSFTSTKNYYTYPNAHKAVTLVALELRQLLLDHLGLVEGLDLRHGEEEGGGKGRGKGRRMRDAS